jgi:hypothetical protein
MRIKFRSIKIGSNHYRVPIPKRRMQVSADLKISVCEHKGRLAVAFTRGWDNEFYGCDTLNRTQALKLICFLSDYVNMVKPTEATALNASLKASTNRIIKTGQELTALAVKSED